MMRGGGAAAAGGRSRIRSATRRAIAGAGSSQSTGQGATGAEALEQQRIMRAGEHDGVGAPAVRVDEAAGDLGLDGRVGDRLRRQLGFGEAGEPRRADQRDVAAGGEFADQRAGIFARRRWPACRARRRACVTDCAQAGLIAGTVPTNGTVNRARNSAAPASRRCCRRSPPDRAVCAAIASPITSTMRAISAASGWLP